jgi:hypothetical protein
MPKPTCSRMTAAAAALQQFSLVMVMVMDVVLEE